MPLFSSKFSPKKTAPRRADASIIQKSGDGKAGVDLGLEVGPIKLRLGDQEALFEDGQWIPESGPVSGTHKENQRLRKYVQQLEDENSLLKLKFEILLDMLTETTAEAHSKEAEKDQYEKEIHRTKKKLDRSNK